MGFIALGLVRALLVADAHDVFAAAGAALADYPRLGAAVINDMTGALEGEDCEDFSNWIAPETGETSAIDEVDGDLSSPCQAERCGRCRSAILSLFPVGGPQGAPPFCFLACVLGAAKAAESRPSCAVRKLYVLHENQCRNPDCGFSLEGYTCALCEEQLTLDDYRYGDGGLCGYHTHVMSKDD
jgi:hypothetical protein